MKRKFCIAGNWKMNFTEMEAIHFAENLKEELKDIKHDLLVAPSFICIPGVKDVLENSNIKLASQNMSNQESGAYTGEISPLMLKGMVEYVILGHSERRMLYKESDEFINEKVQLALKHSFKVILCIGETLNERENKTLWDVIKKQLQKGLLSVSAKSMENLIIAYEPVWAIGTGKTASPQDAEEVHAFIRENLKTTYSKEVSDKTIILYGGSVKPSNATELMAMENIDGALIGGASLKLEDFAAIARFDK